MTKALPATTSATLVILLAARAELASNHPQLAGRPIGTYGRKPNNPCQNDSNARRGTADSSILEAASSGAGAGCASDTSVAGLGERRASCKAHT
ncbi:hypothetical protein, partial [Klebsiella michiganensis]|uniref:hypothetical protein n=1 Tax=Klebsiella michiganensis TaxID=1134687 RepID=UPI001C6E747B